MNETMLLQAIGQMMDEKLDTRLGPLETRIDSMESKMDAIQTDLQEVKDRTLKLEVALENETNRNIKLLMEGHSQIVADIKEIKKKVDKIDDIETRLFAVEIVTKENSRSIAELQTQVG